MVLHIDVGKDSCIDGVSTNILKYAMFVNVRAVQHLFSTSLSHGIFPRKWAMGYINILPKGGDKKNPSNWRPITQTCVLAKPLAKLVTVRLLGYFKENNVSQRVFNTKSSF